ncbi:MAG: efflux RND transporter permease subunit, partial [Sandaracinaceae bacterium]|nr:efflux RND transporter permease subunit [Sandaracinaceae bacterium]
PVAADLVAGVGRAAADARGQLDRLDAAPVGRARAVGVARARARADGAGLADGDAEAGRALEPGGAALSERALAPPEARAPILETVLEASREVRSAIVSATVVIVLVFVPLLLLGGFEGRLLSPLAVSYLVAILASLVVAVTVTPVLASLLLPSRRAAPAREPPLVRLLQRLFAPALDRSLAHPIALAAGSGVLTAAAIASLFFAGQGFLPELREGSLNVAVVLPPGTSLEQSDSLARLAEQALLSDPAVLSTTRRTGRAERDEHVQGPEASELEVVLRDDPRPREELLEDLRGALAVVPGAQFTFGQPISHRIDHMISGQRSALAVRLVGDDLEALRAHAARVGEALQGIDGLTDVQVEPIVDIPQLVVDVDPDAAAARGLSRGEAARTIGLALWGEEVGRIFEEGTVTSVVVRFDDALREDPVQLREALIPTLGGASVPLSSLAEVRVEPAPNYILREGARRRVLVTANLANLDAEGAARAIRSRLDALAPPPGVSVELSGQAEQQSEAQSRLLGLGALALIGIVLVVGATLRSARRTFVVLANLPFALAGGVAGVFFAGGVMTIATTIGFITLLGIATRNGILLATRCRDLE